MLSVLSVVPSSTVGLVRSREIAYCDAVQHWRVGPLGIHVFACGSKFMPDNQLSQHPSLQQAEGASRGSSRTGGRFDTLEDARQGTTDLVI